MLSKSQKVVIVGVLAASARAAAEPADKPVQTEAPRLLCIPPLAVDAKCKELPPGRFLPAPLWSKLDAEMHRLQTAETRLTAENKSLHTAVNGWSPGWRTLGTTLASGFAAGIAFERWFR